MSQSNVIRKVTVTNFRVATSSGETRFDDYNAFSCVIVEG